MHKSDTNRASNSAQKHQSDTASHAKRGAMSPAAREAPPASTGR